MGHEGSARCIRPGRGETLWASAREVDSSLNRDLMRPHANGPGEAGKRPKSVRRDAHGWAIRCHPCLLQIDSGSGWVWSGIQLDEGAMLWGGVVVNCAGDEFVARAAFPGDKHGGIRGRDELNLLHHFPQTGPLANDVAEVVSTADFFPKVGVLVLKPGVLLFHQYPVGNVDEHRACVVAARGRPGPPLDPHRLAVVLAA